MGTPRPTVLLHRCELPIRSRRHRASVDRLGAQGLTAARAQPVSCLCGTPPAVPAYGLSLALWEGFPLWRLRCTGASREPALQGLWSTYNTGEGMAPLECDHGRWIAF